MGTLKTRFAASQAAKLRSGQTDAERRLWARLRNRQLAGYKFVRQVPIGPFITDFACREANLIVELDGSQHQDSMADARRTEVLGTFGYDVVRFWNNDVLSNTDGVLQVILQHLKAPSPDHRFARVDLSPKGEVGRLHPQERNP